MSTGSVESSQPRPLTGTKTLRRSRNRLDKDGIVLIDVDSYVPESVQKKQLSSRLLSKDKKGSRATVICLDDDENYESNNSQTGMNGRNLNNGASTSNSSRHVSGYVDDDCEFIYVSPVRLAKGKWTYSGKGTSYSDYIDCDLMDDSFLVRELWEKAFWRRKSDTCHGQSGEGHECVNVAKVQNQHEGNSFVGKNSETKSAPAHSLHKENGSPRSERDSLSNEHPTDCGHRLGRQQFEKNDASYNTVDGTKGNPSEANEGPRKSTSKSRVNYGFGDQLDDQDDLDSSIVGEREKFKETNEYKKALKEELASRQQALQAQAEEAQNMRRLRKREKAESMRLMNMERSQKQRIEEIRETQKKDVEDMNLKEVIRASVRKELTQLENSCYNMASLLQCLGVLDAGSIPPSDQVHLAYKKALLTFHPNRASRSDIRQQVEAEEKFKLISRMKEKYLLPM